MIRDELVAALPHLRQLPDRIDRVLTLDLHAGPKNTFRFWMIVVNRALLCVIGSVFLVVATLMLIATEKGPIVASGTGLFEILGYGGLIAGTVLLLRVAAAVARDGTT